MVTTIQISQELKSELDALKFRGETYEDVILDLIEDRELLKEETRIRLHTIKKNIQNGEKTYSIEEIIQENDL